MTFEFHSNSICCCCVFLCWKGDDVDGDDDDKEKIFDTLLSSLSLFGFTFLVIPSTVEFFSGYAWHLVFLFRWWSLL